MPELSHCAALVRRHDNDRFLCAVCAPADRRDALFALYAFNHEIVSIAGKVSEPLLGQIRLQWWREAIAGAFEGGTPRGHQVLDPLAGAIHTHRLERPPFEGMIDARAADFDPTPFADMAALEAHVGATAGTLGRIALRILAVNDRDAQEAARHVGLAAGSVDILRELPLAATRRRLTLPLASVRAAGLDAEEIFARKPSGRLTEVVGELAQFARRHLSAARLHRGDVPDEALPALLPAVLADGYLNRLEAVGFDPFHVRLRQPGAMRAAHVWLAARRRRY